MEIWSLREKCPNTEFFLVRIQSEQGEHGPEIAPYLDSFYAVDFRNKL